MISLYIASIGPSEFTGTNPNIFGIVGSIIGSIVIVIIAGTYLLLMCCLLTIYY